MKNIFLIHNNDRDDNLGDQIISQVLSEALAHFGSVNIVGNTKDYHRFPVYEGPMLQNPFLRMMAFFTGSKYYQVSPAGGLGKLHLKVGVSAGSLVKLYSKICRCTGMKKILLGVSVEIDPADDRFDYYTWVGVRDERSLASLKQRPKIRATYFPDLSFLLPYQDSHVSNSESIAVSFREQIPEDNHPIEVTTVQQILRSLSEAMPVDGSITYYHQVSEDKSFMKKLSEADTSGSLHPEQLNLQTYPNFYSRSRYVVSNRLHCLLLAAIHGCIPIAFTHSCHHKLVDFYHTLGWDRLLILTDEPICWGAKILDILTEEKSLRQMIKDTCLSQYQLGWKLLKMHLA